MPALGADRTLDDPEGWPSTVAMRDRPYPPSSPPLQRPGSAPTGLPVQYLYHCSADRAGFDLALATRFNDTTKPTQFAVHPTPPVPTAAGDPTVGALLHPTQFETK